MVYRTDSQQLLHFLHLISPTLPVGAYSYSEGLEACVEKGLITSALQLQDWLEFELAHGAIRVESAIVLRSHQSMINMDYVTLQGWQDWLSAFRETEEIRLQSLQMGRSLLRLLTDTGTIPSSLSADFPDGCHFAIAFAIAAVHWHIGAELAVLGYVQSWLTNLINAGVRLVPLGQTEGQQTLLNLYPKVSSAIAEIRVIEDDELWSCNWGNSLASMAHETQYSRLFRS